MKVSSSHEPFSVTLATSRSNETKYCHGYVKTMLDNQVIKWCCTFLWKLTYPDGTPSGGSHAIFLFDPFPDIKIHLLPPDLCLLFLTEKIWDNFMS
jgi:hypothetical protein